jgi:hypothetical protein
MTAFGVGGDRMAPEFRNFRKVAQSDIPKRETAASAAAARCEIVRIGLIRRVLHLVARVLQLLASFMSGIFGLIGHVVSSVLRLVRAFVDLVFYVVSIHRVLLILSSSPVQQWDAWTRISNTDFPP